MLRLVEVGIVGERRVFVVGSSTLFVRLGAAEGVGELVVLGEVVFPIFFEVVVEIVVEVVVVEVVEGVLPLGPLVGERRRRAVVVCWSAQLAQIAPAKFRSPAGANDCADHCLQTFEVLKTCRQRGPLAPVRDPASALRPTTIA